MLYGLISLVLRLYRLALIAYVVLSWIRIPSNRWTVLLERIIEPVLQPVRVFLHRKVPEKYLMIDWSPVALWLLIEIVDMVLGFLL